MALVFPNTPANYKAFFEELATTHKLIRHNENPNRQNFCMISIKSGISGFADNDIRAFLDKARTKTSAKSTESESSCQMIVEMMDTSHSADQLKVGSKGVVGSFSILTHPKEKSIAENDSLRDTCYQVGMDIVAAMRNFFSANYSKGKILAIETEPIRVNSNVGWRFDFEFVAYASVCYDSTKFDNLTITELP